jgi:hypothetical protein
MTDNFYLLDSPLPASTSKALFHAAICHTFLFNLTYFQKMSQVIFLLSQDTAGIRKHAKIIILAVYFHDSEAS